MLKTKTVTLQWHNSSKKHYVSKGYQFTSKGSEFEVSSHDLYMSSTVKVKVSCDDCADKGIEVIFEIKWCQYREDKRDVCEECKSKVGKRFGKLLVLERLDEFYRNDRLYLCECSCESETVFKVRQSSLSSGGTTTCGCGQKENMRRVGKSRKLDLRGDTFNKLTMLEPTDKYTNDGRVVWKCRCECGEIAYFSGSKVSRGLIKSCGCINKATGKDHFLWKEDISEEDRQLKRYGIKYKIWRDDVFMRDDYRCQCCFRRGGDVNAHHIYSYSKFKDLRLNINNGITLCEDCHTEFHQTYGYKDFTPENFQEFFYLKTEKQFNLFDFLIKSSIKINNNEVIA